MEKIRVYSSAKEMGLAVADFLCTAARSAIEARGVCSIALSGGRTPSLLYTALGKPFFSRKKIWSRCHFFWCDERCVPPHHPESNYRMAHDAFLSKVSLPPGHIHRMPAEKNPAPSAARSYASELRQFFQISFSQVPLFDMMLLGLGEDGHTASLFSGNPVLQEKRAWVRAISAPAGVKPPQRLTLTFPVINNARHVIMLVAGREKKAVVKSLLEQPPKKLSYPASLIRPKGQLLWFLDKAAAGSHG